MKYLLTTILSCLYLVAAAQVQVGHAIKVGTTPPLTEIVPVVGNAYVSKVRKQKKQRQIPNFVGKSGLETPVMNPNALPIGVDKLATTAADRRISRIDLAPELVLEGLASDFVPDPAGDKGPDHYVQIVNASDMMVWNNDGERLLQTPFQLANLWASVGKASGGDPIVLYDFETGKWMITEFPPGFSQFLLVAISKTGDPLGDYDVYEFGTPGFPDYPKYAIWEDKVIVTTNEGGGIPVYAINKTQLFSGAAVVDLQRSVVPRIANGPGFQVITPVDYNGYRAPAPGTDPIVMRMNDDSWGEVEEDLLQLFSFHVDWDNPNNSAITLAQNIVPTPFDSEFCQFNSNFSFACVPQPNGQGIDGIKETLMNQIHYRNQGTHESIVVCHTTDVTGDDHAGIRWYELRRSIGAADWTLYQEGTHSPDTDLHRFIPAIAIDRNNNIGLAYSVSSDSYNPSIRFTGRKAGDPLGEMTVTEYEVYTGGGSLNDDRYGDYAGMVVDPVDELTFWFTGEYVESNRQSATGVFSFTFGKDDRDLRASDIIGPGSTADLTVEDLVIEISNNGATDIETYTYGYQFGSTSTTFDNTEVLPTDSTIIVTLPDALTFDTIGTYPITFWVNTTSDDNILNDTIESLLIKLPTQDLTVSSIGGEDALYCGPQDAIDINVTNLGVQAIDSFLVQYYINDNSDVRSITVTEPLESGATAQISVEAANIVQGDNEVGASVVDYGVFADQVADNNTIVSNISVILDGDPTTMTLDLDEYPAETSYLLVDSEGNTIASGGPYDGAQAIETWCLSQSECYTLTIFDSFSDGIFDDPSLSIIQGSVDSVLVDIDDINFSREFVVDFCLTQACAADLTLSAIDETADGTGDGLLMVSEVNTTGGYSISIDGGSTYTQELVYDSLPGGLYTVILYDSLAMCSTTSSITINTCTINATATVTDASSTTSSDGSIRIELPGDPDNATYTLVGITEPQSGAFFNGLAVGTYSVIVTYGNSCSVTIEDITVDAVSSTSELGSLISTRLYPNPTDGRLQVEISGITDRFRLGYTIYDVNGSIVMSGRLPKYDNRFVGEIRMYHLPDAVYLLKVDHPDAHNLLRIIKQ